MPTVGPRPSRLPALQASPNITMLLLFESAAGFCLFKVLNEGKLKEAETQVRAGGLACKCMHGACRQAIATLGRFPAAAGPPTARGGRMHPRPFFRRMFGATLRPQRLRRRCGGVRRDSRRPWAAFRGGGGSGSGGRVLPPRACLSLSRSCCCSRRPQVVKLKAFSKFENTAEALQAAASLVDSKISKGTPPPPAARRLPRMHARPPAAGHAAEERQLRREWRRRGRGRRRAAASPHACTAAPRRRLRHPRRCTCWVPPRFLAFPPTRPAPRAPPAAGLKKFLKKHAEGDTLAVLDAKLGSVIKEKLGINCLYRCARRRVGKHPAGPAAAPTASASALGARQEQAWRAALCACALRGSLSVMAGVPCSGGRRRAAAEGPPPAPAPTPAGTALMPSPCPACCQPSPGAARA